MASPALAQSDATNDASATLLRKDFPNTWEIFGRRAEAQKADYVIALDVSGSMNHFSETVIGNVSSFLDALPDHDYVSILTFGTDVKIAGVPTEVNSGSRAAIRQALQSVTFREQNTDMEAMVSRVLDELNRPGGNDLKFVFAFTDFDHDPPPARRGKEMWDKLAQRFKTEQSGRQVGFYAMKLELSAKSGRDLPRIQSIFPGLQVIPVDPSTLGGWFQRRKAEVLRDRLRYIVSKAAEQPLPNLVAAAEGNRIRLNLVTSVKNELVGGIKLLSVDFKATPATPTLTSSTMPVTLGTDGNSQTVLATALAGPYFETPLAPPALGFRAEWVIPVAATELGHLGIEISPPPTEIVPRGKITPSAKLVLRASGSTVEGRIEGAPEGLSLRIDSLQLASLGALAQIQPLPIVVGGDWVTLAKVPVTGLVSKSTGAGSAEGTAAFVTAQQPDAASGAFNTPIPGWVSTGRFAIWQLGTVAALVGLACLYVLFTYRPGKKFYGKLTLTPPASKKDISLRDASSLTLTRGSKDRKLAGVAESIPESLRLILTVRGNLFHPVRGQRRLLLEAGSADLAIKSGRTEKKSTLRTRQPVNLPDKVREFEIRSGSWLAHWSKN